MKRIVALVLLTLALPAFSQVPRKPGLLSDSWQNSRHDQYNCRISNGSVRQLTEVCRYSWAGQTWPSNQSEYPNGIVIDLAGNLFISSATWRQIYRVSPWTFARSGTYNWSADAVGYWVPTLYPIAVNGASVALGVSNDALDIFQLRSDGTVAKQARPFSVDLWGDVCMDSQRLYFTNCWSIDNPMGPRVAAVGDYLQGTPHIIWQQNPLPGNRAACEDKNGGLALWSSSIFVTHKYDFKATYTGTKYESGTYCLDRVTGAQRWFAAGMPTSRPTLYQNRCYVIEDIVTPAGQASKLVCRDAVTGVSLWSVAGGNNYGTQRPAIIAGNGYVAATLGGVLACCWYTTGDRKWSVPFDGSKTYGVESFIVGFAVSGTLALYQNPHVLLLDQKTGATLQTVVAPPYASAMAARSDRLYFLSRSYRVAAGKPSWPAILTVYQDVSWLQDGYAPRVLKPLELWPVGLAQTAHVNGYVEGTWPLSFTWTKNGVILAGETKPYLTFVMDASWSGASIGLTVRNAYGQVLCKPIIVPAVVAST